MNGSRADFWRTVRLAKRLGWMPWSLELQKTLPSPEFGGRALQIISASPHGCHAGACLFFEKSDRRDPKDVADFLRQSGGPGRQVVQPGRIHIMRRLVTREDALRPGARTKGGRARLSAGRRADLITSLLRWLPAGERQGWSPAGVDFRRVRRFRASGVAWRLSSDLYFWRSEGLYWNNFLSTAAASRSILRRLDREGFSKRVTADWKRIGFRVYYGLPQEWAFDLNFPSDRRVLELAPKLAQWRP